MAKIVLTYALSLQKVDGSAATSADCASVNLYRKNGDADPVPAGSVDVTKLPAGTTEIVFTDDNLTPGSYGYINAEVDTLGREGPHSEIAPVVVSAPPALLSPATFISAVVS